MKYVHLFKTDMNVFVVTLIAAITAILNQWWASAHHLVIFISKGTQEFTQIKNAKFKCILPMTKLVWLLYILKSQGKHVRPKLAKVCYLTVNTIYHLWLMSVTVS